MNNLFFSCPQKGAWYLPACEYIFFLFFLTHARRELCTQRLSACLSRLVCVGGGGGHVITRPEVSSQG